MRLDSIELRNYRGFERLSVAFRPGLNVIAGVNGSGKTSILKAVREALNGLTSFLSVNGPPLFSYAEPSSTRIQATVTAGRYRFEEQYPVEVIASGEAFGQSIAWTLAKSGPTAPAVWQAATPGSMWQALHSAQAPNATSQALPKLPIVAYYPAYRKWEPSVPNQMSAATERHGRTDGYVLWWEAASTQDSAALQQWVISKTLERLQLTSERAVKWDAVCDDELAMVNVALAAVVQGAAEIRYDLMRKSVLIEWQGNEAPTEFHNLSDGQRVAISLVVDIARRMCLLNPHLGQSVTQQTPGVVLIDELDVHLHPKWQRLMTTGLQAAFPEVQFITTSHSPQVIGELRPEQIILLTADGIAHPAVSYGLDASRVLEQIMDASPRPLAVEQDLSALFEALERNELPHARTLLAALQETAPGIPELAGAEALLKRKEVIGR
ncbi:AAA family ATPase [Burkholderia pyrrocinia]|uniref:AAA family ATPase n=1 Tax=Burkholderia pyrrocinia TaxID=60550 RepID=UPI002AB21DB4|nr:AAA family ATPase [Burkholderia pyrrocinia]